MLNKTKYIWKKYSKFEKFDLIINLLKDNPKGLSMTNKLEYLKESLGYKGHYFLENYLGTKFVKAFVEDALIFGAENTKELYVEIFGEDARPILEEMTSNGLLLFEASRVDTNLLFEDIGIKKVQKHSITEAFQRPSNMSMISSQMMSKETLENIGKRLVKSTGLPIAIGSSQDSVKSLLSLGAAPSTVAGGVGIAKISTSGILGFLQKVWQTIKGFGSGLINKLQTFLSANFPEASKFLAAPLKFLATNPIAQVAVPALLITGGVVLAVKLLNKLRNKVGNKVLDNKEIQEIKQKFDANKEKILELKNSLTANKGREENFA